MENTSFVGKSEPLQVETEVQHEEILAAESIEIQSLDLTPKSSPEPETLKEEEIQPLEFLYSFKDVLFEDFRNTSNYFCQNRPPVPVTPTKLSEKELLKKSINELTLREGPSLNCEKSHFMVREGIVSHPVLRTKPNA
jgi:hypothetical protein